jgi:hypothetical protein
LIQGVKDFLFCLEIASTDDLTQERNSILYDYVNGIIPPDEFDRKIKELKSRGGNLVINEEFMIGAKKDREESAREAINEYIKSKKLPEKERNALLAYNNDNPTAIFNAQTQSFDDGTKFAGTGFIHTKEGKLQKITALNSKGKLVTLVDNPNSRFASDTNSALTNVKDTIQGRSAVVNALTILSQKGASFSSDAAPLYDGSRFIFDVEGFNTQIVTPNAEGGVLLQEVALGNVVRKREYDAAGGITSDVTDPGTGNARGFRIDGDNYIVSDGTSSMSFETKLDELGYRLIKVGDSWRGSNGLFFDDEGKKITDEDTLEKLKDTFDKRLEKEEVDEDAVDRVMEEERFINQFKFTSEDRWRKILGSGDNVFKVGFDVFTEVIGGYEQYRGIGAFGSLFIGDDELNERRDKVNQAFCDTVVLGGQECWSSVMCSKYSDHVAGSGFLSAETPGQGLRGVAHVEAEKTTTTGPNGTVYLYKITYKVNNPNDNILGYNLFFDYPEGRFTWFTTPQLIPKLQSDSRLGSAALVAYSERVYTQVCLGFTGRLDVGPATGSLSKHSPFIKAASGAKVGQVCSPVVNAFGVAGPTINIPSGAVTTNQTQRNNGEGF